MEFKSIKKLGGGTHICRYDLEYETKDHRLKKYEMVSRDQDLYDVEALKEWHSKTVVIIGISQDNDRILLNREFRMALGDWVFNFPSGMMDEDETPTEAAARELKEETGLTLERRIVRLRSSYNAVGITNESSSCVLAVVSGDIQKSDSAFEEIEARWYTKDEVKDLLKYQKMSARAQLFCFAWAYGDLSINKLAEESDEYGDGHLR
ncbi:MAG: NUDIX hydrolase [Lachnospiraceae bacterium]|nr:NUDIX hydrolase [Lachnospiraceae bacterium]